MCHTIAKTLRLFACLAAATLATAATLRMESDDELAQMYLSHTLQHPFLGCNSVRVAKFSDVDEPKKTAELSMDLGRVTFDSFGDLKEPDSMEGYAIGVNLEMLPAEDPLKQGRRLYSVTLLQPPATVEQQLGKNQLRLVWTPPTARRPGSIRLLLVNAELQVLQTLELRKNGT